MKNKILLLLISLSSVVYTMEKEHAHKELQKFEKNTESVIKEKLNLASISKSDEFIEDLGEREAGSSKPNSQIRTRATLSQTDIDETKKQKEPADDDIDLEEAKKKDPRHSIKKIDLEKIGDITEETKNLVRTMYGENHKKDKHIKPLTEKIRKESTSASATESSRGEKIQKELDILREASSTERSTHRTKKSEDPTPPTKFTSFLPPGSDLDELKEIANKYFHEHELSQERWLLTYKIGGGVVAVILAGLSATIAAVTKTCPKCP
jgi:hypothetical protein